jgi:hypothetical protein
MALRKSAPVVEQTVPIAEVLAYLAGNGSPPDVWQVEAEQVAATMRAAVVRDWRQRPCLTWTDAERFYQRQLRDREEAARARAEAAKGEDQAVRLMGGVVQLERPGEAPVQAPWMVNRGGHGRAWGPEE